MASNGFQYSLIPVFNLIDRTLDAHVDAFRSFIGPLQLPVARVDEPADPVVVRTGKARSKGFKK